MTSANSSDGASGGGRVDRLRRRYPWLDHLLLAGKAYTSNHGDHYAAAITYFSVLALFPLLMIGFAAAGFVLAANPELLLDVKQKITQGVPGDFGGTLNDLVDQAIESRNAVGVVGLLGALYTGLGWMGNLREALTAQWEQPHDGESFLRQKASDLLALVGLGMAIALTIGVSTAGAFADDLLELAQIDSLPGASVLVQLASLLVAIAAGWVVFGWVIVRLPREPVTWRSGMAAALFAAVGFEVLKQVIVLLLRGVTSGPAGAIFGPVIGIMVFIFTTSRFLLFVTAWAATAPANRKPPAPPRPPAPAVINPVVEVRRGGVGAMLTAAGIGALAGALGGGLRRRILWRRSHNPQ